jgi:hypothetical protein
MAVRATRLDTMNAFVVSWLIKRRAELAGEIERTAKLYARWSST